MVMEGPGHRLLNLLEVPRSCLLHILLEVPEGCGDSLLPVLEVVGGCQLSHSRGGHQGN